MKIAILTLPLHFNYGGNLQCYALSTVLKRMGHEVTNIRLIQEVQLPPLKKRPYLYLKRFVNKISGRKYGCVFAEKKLIRDRHIVQKYADEFITKYIPHTRKGYKSMEALEEMADIPFDAYIVGSDQVWRPKYAFPDIRAFFLSFLKEKKVLKIAYAASFGTSENEYTEEQIHDCGILIEDFDAVSVRENSGMDLIEQTFHWKCKKLQHLLDPTMLLDKNDYLQLCTDAFPTPNNGLFYYILDMDTDKEEILEQICRSQKLTPFTVFPKSTSPCSKIEDKIVPPVEQWLNAFHKAKYVVTDSFHGCVFSILFNKPFIVYANQKRGNARFNSLLMSFHLEERMVASSQDLKPEIINTAIDWEQINKIRKQQKEIALSFLTDNLSTKQQKQAF